MSQLSRRKFIAATAGAATYLGTMSAEASEPPARPPIVPLGNTGITMSRVGQGTGMKGGNRQSNHTRMGFDNFKALIRRGYERGITFYDMADLYGTHIYYREAMNSIAGSKALKSVDREKLTLLTKLWWRYETGGPRGKAEPWCKKVCRTTLERFRHELDTDYIDIVLLHCLVSKDWVSQLEPYMDALNDAKAKGEVKAVGVSCHNLEALTVAAECPWVDVILARINPEGARMDGKTEDVVPVLRLAKQNGKAIIGMKILGEGTLADQRDRCIQFAQKLGLLDAMTIGFEEPDQIDDILRLMEKYPAAKVS
jgi:aryl-alcohol dehydrogenase-like predicted oxidoreductase